MARGEHPMRTPVYGGALIVGAMVVATVVTSAGVPAAARIAVYLVCLAAALVGIVLTFRDYG
jgi:UDP-N-acetylmuramyl pentapeptide phosphotransferase/UDP-N-acetylglucosamine-1-phosphate transferase